MGRGGLHRAGEALSSSDFRSLILAKLCSQFADGLFQAFLIDRLVFLSAESGTALGVARAYALLVIPFSVLGPATGVVIDRLSRRKILVAVPLVRAGAILGVIALFHVRTNVPLYALTLVVVSANRFYLATAGAVIPRLVPDRDLLVANSLSAATGSVAGFAGLVAGTQLAGPLGGRGLLTVGAVLLPTAAFVAWRIRHPLRADRVTAGLGAEVRLVAGELSRGARRLAATPAALGSVVSVSVDQLLIGLITVLSVVVFKDEFRQGVASYGRIIGAGGVGVLLGTISVGWFEGRVDKPRIMALAFAVAGAVCAAGAIRIAGPTILLISFTLGLTYPWRKVPADTLIQASIPDRFRGRVFALYDLAFSMPRVLAAAAAIVLIPRLSPGQMVALIGAAYLLWAPVPVRWLDRMPRVGIRFYAGGRADEVPRALVIGGEEAPVQVVSTAMEEEAGRPGPPRRRFVLRTEDGTTYDVVGGDGGQAWNVVRRGAGGDGPGAGV